MHPARRADLIAVSLLALAALAGILLWSSLPETMVVHWSGGSPDSAVGKPLAVLGIPALGVASVAFVRFAPSSMTNTPGGENAAVLFLGVVVTWVQGIVLAWNLGWEFSVGLAVVPILVLAGLLVLYARMG
ncbi:MAG: DUF1648 domain-containing protein [Halanaeroarchaeum sp.]